MVKKKKRRVVRKTKAPQSIISDDIFIPNHSGMLDAGKVHRTPTDELDPVNKKYVDDADDLKVPYTGATGNADLGTYNLVAGNIDTTSDITSLGLDTGTVGVDNGLTFIGYQAGKGNSGNDVVAIGTGAGLNNAERSNIFIGADSGVDNTGIRGIGLGEGTLDGSSGDTIVAIGDSAGNLNSGNDVIGIGGDATASNSGNDVIGIGDKALKDNTGNNVVAIGDQAGLNNTTSNQFILKQAGVNATPLIQGDFSSGNVGIGTATPAYPLQVASGGNTIFNVKPYVGTFLGEIHVRAAGTSGSAQIGAQHHLAMTTVTGGNIDLATTGGAVTARFTHNNNYVNRFNFVGAATGNSPTLSTAGTDTNIDLIINPQGTGKVGIGTTEPLSKLNIDGGVGSLDTGLTFGDGDTGIYEGADDQLRIAIVGVEKGRFSVNGFDSGGFNIGATLIGNANTLRPAISTATSATNPGFTFRDDEDTGLGRAAANELSLITNATERIRIDSSGNVGINTTTPDAKLQIVGDCKIGDDNTNYASFSSAGDLSFTGSADLLIGNNKYAFRSQANENVGLYFNASNLCLDLRTTTAATVHSLCLNGDYVATGAISSGTSTFSTTGPTDNVDVTGINTLFVNTASNNVTIGGFAGGVAGQYLFVVRTSNLNTLTFEHIEAGGSQDIYMHDGADFTMIAGEWGGATFVCDGSDWFDVSHAKHV